jgi:two-component system, chemotaxis family, chemotaxis protein CheY
MMRLRPDASRPADREKNGGREGRQGSRFLTIHKEGEEDNMKALVVDDDFVSRRILHTILAPYGECDVAVNGNEAIQAFQMALDEDKPYDLICLDIMMPEKNGHDTLKTIRDLEKERGVRAKKEVKVIMTTAIDDPRSVMTSYRNQAEAYLVKPIDREKLVGELGCLGLDTGRVRVVQP